MRDDDIEYCGAQYITEIGKFAICELGPGHSGKHDNEKWGPEQGSRRAGY
jgi:hypothetical protein